MDNILYGAVCNHVVKVHYLSDAGFITRGLFCNNTRFIDSKNIVYNNYPYFYCYEFFRNKKVKIRDETRILEMSFENPPGAKAGAIIHGELQPTKEFVDKIVLNFPEVKDPLGRGNINKLSEESKRTIISFFADVDVEIKKNKINEIINDILCSEIFLKVPMGELFDKYVSRGESFESQWLKILELYIELSIHEINSDKSMSRAEKNTMIASIKQASNSKIEYSKKLESAYWPKQLMPKPNWFSF